MTDKTKTTPIATEEVNLNFLMDVPHIDGFKRMKLSKDIHAAPVRSALDNEQLLIHVRAYDEGYHAASKYWKQEITRNFQLAMFGHTL